MEKNSLRRKKARNAENGPVAVSILIIAIIFASIYFALTPGKTHAATPVPSELSDYCIQAREDAINLRAAHIPEGYGAELTKLCGELN